MIGTIPMFDYVSVIMYYSCIIVHIARIVVVFCPCFAMVEYKEVRSYNYEY